MRPILKPLLVLAALAGLGLGTWKGWALHEAHRVRRVIFLSPVAEGLDTGHAFGLQRLPGGRQDVHAGCRTKNFLGGGRDRLDHVLATIEDDELLGAVLILVPPVVAFGGLLLSCVMIGATITHLFVIGGSPVPALVLLTLSAIVAYAKRSQFVLLASAP